MIVQIMKLFVHIKPGVKIMFRLLTLVLSKRIQTPSSWVVNCKVAPYTSVSKIDGNFHQNDYHFRGRGQY